MVLHRVYGHDGLAGRLGEAVASGRLPQTTLLTGPPGVGKQRLALWLAQTTLCDGGAATPCGTCAPCRQVLSLSHPDLHWFVPLTLKTRSSDPDKQVMQVEEALGEVMVARREQMLYQPPDGQANHPFAAVRLLQRRIALRPFQGHRKFVILGEAERFASPEAANALLKVLEEPPEDTDLVLTSGAPQGLLPTIRSRLVPIRVQRIPEAHVRDFLVTEVGLSEAAAARAAQMAQGCPGRALRATETADTAAREAEALLAALKRGPRAWAERALSERPFGARGAFTAMLDALALRLRAQLERAAGGVGTREEGGAGNQELRRVLDALRIVATHRAAAQGYVNPQVSLAVLASELQALK